MPARPDMTVVIRMRGLLLRADVAGGAQPRVTRWRRDWSEAADAVRHALGDGGRPGKRVWVLDTEVWLGVVELSGSAVAGLADKDLVGPAAYEAEALSGLRPVEAVTAVQRRRMADQDDQFLVAQARRGDVTAVAKAVRGAGGKLAGFGHPAGLSEPLELDSPAETAGGWRRVEFWADSVVLAEALAGRVGLIPLGIAPQSEWRRALDPVLRHREPVAQEQTLIEPGVRVRGGTQWRESTAVTGHARWLEAGEDGEDDDDSVTVRDLADDATADAFAAAWTRQLAAVKSPRESVTAMMRAPKAPAARWPAVAVGVLLLAGAVALVLHQRQRASEQLTQLQARLEHVQADREALADRRGKVNLAKAEVSRKQQEVEKLEAQYTQAVQQIALQDTSGPRIADRREALSRMMAALTSAAAGDVVIQSIEHGSPRHEITGLASNPEAASRLARDLSVQLRDHWQVSPASIEPHTRAERLVWEFSITIEPSAALGFTVGGTP